MRIDIQNKKCPSIKILFLVTIILSACGSQSEITTATPESNVPEWFAIPLIDVQTGESFNMKDFSGKVVLVETMAIWCPNCIIQANEVRELHALLGETDDLISVSLDIDVNEEAPALKDYAEGYGFDWHFSIAPLEIARALGNSYGANYLNPPLSPMLVIDRNGSVHTLEHGKKDAETLLTFVQPFLSE